jgi:hypothetical protein
VPDMPIFHLYSRRGNRSVAGSNAMIMVAPESIYVTMGRIRGISLPHLARTLRAFTEDGANSIGAQLHHASWIMTHDPDLIRGYESTDGCPGCTARIDQCISYLREHPDQDLLVGTLYWADTRTSTS